MPVDRWPVAESHGRTGLRAWLSPWAERLEPLRAPRHAWLPAAGGALLLVLLALALSARAWQVHQQALVARVAQGAAERSLQALQAAGAADSTSSEPAHPALLLGSEPDGDQVMGRIEHAAREAGVSIRRMELSRFPASERELGRLQLALVVQGSYGPLKRWMAEWMARLPSATVSQLRLERVESTDPAAPMLEWSGVVTLWSRPLQQPGAR